MFCRICGTENIEEAIFCENCGARLSDEVKISESEIDEPTSTYIPETTEEEEPIHIRDFNSKSESNEKNDAPLIAVIIAVAVVILGLAVWLLLPGITDVGWNSPLFSPKDTQVVSKVKEEKKKETDEEDETKVNEEEDEAEDAEACKKYIEEAMEAISNGETYIIYECLHFEMMSEDDLADAIEDELKYEFNRMSDYEIDFEDAAEELAYRYFNSINYYVKDAQKYKSKYKVEVVFTHIDKEQIIEDLCDWDAEKSCKEIEKKLIDDNIIDEYTDENDVRKMIEYELEKIAEEEMIKAIENNDEAQDDTLEFVLASDDGKWVVVSGEGDFDELKYELGE